MRPAGTWPKQGAGHGDVGDTPPNQDDRGVCTNPQSSLRKGRPGCDPEGANHHSDHPKHPHPYVSIPQGPDGAGPIL